ncbi:oligosaccharide flippase family protein [Desulfobacter vibrioformis]|uniref:oligosaccharide flippase family protein n=1 Tax=Desulfobacter vibrioformis TaxID=34031 RepID=UPI0014706F3E|nr:oligosaccharide flippase family protein [Desulfobacter vibrioformis]
MSDQRPVSPSGDSITTGMAVGMLTTFVHLVSRLLLVPLILHFVPMAHYGLWTICFVILSYAGMSAFGIQNAYIKYVAKYWSLGDRNAINILISTGLTVMGIASLLIYFTISLGVPLILGLFHVEKQMHALAGFMIRGTAAAFLLEIWLGAFKASLEGLQKITLTRLNWLFATLSEIVLIFIFFMMGYGIHGVVFAYIIKTIFEMGLHLIFAFRHIPSLSLRPMLNRQAFNALFVYGGKVQGLGILGLFLGTFDRLVITAMIGLEATALIEIGRKLPFTARRISGAAFAPYLPAASSQDHYFEKGKWPTTMEKMRKYSALFTIGLIIAAWGMVPWGGSVLQDAFQQGKFFSTPWGWLLAGAVLFSVYPGISLVKWAYRFVRHGETLCSDTIRDLYLSGSGQINLINGIIYGYLIAAAPQLLFAWVGPEGTKAYTITIIIAAATVIHLTTGIGTAILKGVDRTGRELEYTLIQLALALVWIPGFAAYGGLMGAVWGTALSLIIPSVFFVWRGNVFFQVSFSLYVKKNIRPCLAPVSAAVLIAALLGLMPPLSRWFTLLEVMIAGLFYLLMTAVFLKLWIFTDDEWQKIISPLGKIKAKFLPRVMP